ncbi:hypothetical protein BDV59DRAFT_168966 [Aspergillus ambiguus]|uniref:uncharacterized protein n=1 Tax=Aspergillus ambiguus TaxID=176160 RepID=UPI003CCD8010
MPIFPSEIILQIVESIVSPTSRKIHQADDPVTITLISLTLTCKLTYPAARRLLFRHCLFIDETLRLDSLLDRSGYFVDDDADGPEAYSLFLAPFPAPTLDEWTIHQIDRLFTRICSSLRVLVVDMPLRNIWPYEDLDGIRRPLREAFCRLKMLEDVCSVQDELFLRAVDDYEPQVWTLWPRLRRLALYNPDIDDYFVAELQKCPDLAHLVIMRPDSYMYERIPDHLAEGFPFGLQRVVVANTRGGHIIDADARSCEDSSVWRNSFWGRMVLSQYPEGTGEEREMLFHIDVPWDPKDQIDDISVCQKWLLEHAVDGTVWEVPGTHCSMEYALTEIKFGPR